MFKDKILVITGGTGSFGNAVLEKFLNSNLKEIRIFSRDEKNYAQLSEKFFYNQFNQALYGLTNADEVQESFIAEVGSKNSFHNLHEARSILEDV